MEYDNTYGVTKQYCLIIQIEDFIVIMLYGNERNQKLAFWRNGDSKWRRVLHDEAKYYSDIVWCNDNLYALKTYEDLSVQVWDFNRNGLCSGFPKKKSMIIKGQSYSWKLGMKMNQLVVSSIGEVLVAAYYEVEKKWKVFKVDLSEERCAELKTLNEQALIMVGIESKPSSKTAILLVKNNLFCVSSIDVEKNGYRANSIYLAKCDRSNNGTFDRKIKLSNYSFEDNKVEEVWETSIPFDVNVKLHPLGLCSLNISSRALISSRWSKRCK